MGGGLSIAQHSNLWTNGILTRIGSRRLLLGHCRLFTMRSLSLNDLLKHWALALLLALFGASQTKTPSNNCWPSTQGISQLFAFVNFSQISAGDWGRKKQPWWRRGFYLCCGLGFEKRSFFLPTYVTAEEQLIIDRSCSYITVNDAFCGQQKWRFPLFPKVERKDPGSETGKCNNCILSPLCFFCFTDAFAALMAAFLVFSEIMRPERDQ